MNREARGGEGRWNMEENMPDAQSDFGFQIKITNQSKISNCPRPILL